MNTISLKNKNSIILSAAVFTAFFIFIWIAQQYVWPYLDDYGYASLSYINVIPGVTGTHFNFSQFIEYYRLHYLTITGRIFWQSLASLILQNLWVARLAQSAAITLLAVSLTTVISRNSKAKPYLIALVVCCLYGLIEVFVIDKSIYWFSASVLYVWPLIPFLFAADSYWRHMRENRAISGRKLALLGVCVFFVSTAQEQIAVAQSVLLILIILYFAFKTKRLSIAGVLLLAVSIGGFLFVALSPATGAKMELLKSEPSYASMLSMSLGQKIASGYHLILKYVFSKNFYLLMLCMFGCGFWAGYRLLRQKRGIRAVNIAAVVVFLFAGVFMLVKNIGLYQGMFEFGIPTVYCDLAATLLILLLAYCFAAYGRMKGTYFTFFAFVAAWASVFSIIVVYSPVSGRTYIIFVILSILFMGSLIAGELASANKKVRFLVIPLLAVVAAVNMFGYTQQYYFGNSMQMEDDQRLRGVSQAIRDGQDIRSVEVISYPNIMSDSLNPNEGSRIIYNDPRTPVAIKEYYDIPQSVQFTWQHRVDPNIPLK